MAATVRETLRDLAASMQATVDALGRRITYSYDLNNRQTQVQDPAGDLTTTVYDNDGNVAATVDALNSLHKHSVVG